MFTFCRVHSIVLLVLFAGMPGPSRAQPPVELFATHCAACHGMDGKARTPAGRKLKAKDFSRSTLADSEIERLILEGMKDAKGTARMPPFKEKIPPTDVSLLVEYVKTFRSP